MQREEISDLVDMSNPAEKRALVLRVAPLAELYEVTLAPRKNTRRLRANRFYFGVCVKLFVDFMRDQGTETNKDDAHEFLKERYGLRRSIVNPETGEEFQVMRSTTGYSIEEFSDYIGRVIEFLGGLTIYVPEPLQVGMDYSPEPERAKRVKSSVVITTGRRALPSPESYGVTAPVREGVRA